MVCMSCSTCSDLQKSGSQEYKPSVVSFWGERLLYQLIGSKVSAFVLFIFGYATLVAVVGILNHPKADGVLSLTCQPLFGGLSELEGVIASQEFRNIWVCFPICMRALVLYSGDASLQFWKTMYYLLVRGTILLMVANLDFVCWVDSIVVNLSTWIDELKISLYFS